VTEQQAEQAAPRRRGRPQRITRDQIVTAAIEIGTDDLRMSDVARALDVGAAALYNHVKDRDELLALMAARIMEETEFDDFEPGPDADWRDWVVSFARAVRSAVLAHPQLLRYVRLTSAPTSLRLDRIEHLAAAMEDAGFRTADIQHAVQHVYTLALGEAWQRTLADGGEDPQFAEFGRGVRERRGDLPHLEAMIAALPDPDVQFEFALDALVLGLEHRLT
jgi:AcrR family transcriptional regulator